MQVSIRVAAVAVGVATLSAVVALYATRPSPPRVTSTQFVGRDRPSLQPADPLTSDEIGYTVPRDKIKAIDAPTFLSASQAAFVPDRMPVLGLTDGHEAKAYPIPLLSRVEIVNDQIGGRALAVTW